MRFDSTPVAFSSLTGGQGGEQAIELNPAIRLSEFHSYVFSI